MKQQYSLTETVRHNYFEVPRTKGYNYIVTMQSGSVAKELELISYYKNDLPYTPSFSFAGYSDEPWKTTVLWEKYEKAGTLIGTYVDTPSVVSVDRDSSLAKIWAGSESPFTEKHKRWELGSYFGIVHDSTSAVVLNADSGRAVEGDPDTLSVAYFLDEDFITGENRGSEKAFIPSPFTLHIQVLKGKVLLHLGYGFRDKPLSVEIVNLRGRTVYSEDFSILPGTMEISKNALPAGMYVLSVRGQSRTLKRMFTIY